MTILSKHPTPWRRDGDCLVDGNGDIVYGGYILSHRILNLFSAAVNLAESYAAACDPGERVTPELAAYRKARER